MIRDFLKDDFSKIKANEFFARGVVSDEQFIEMLESYYVWTLEHKGNVVCIIMINHFIDNIYHCGLVFSEDFEPICARELKRFIYGHVIPVFKPRRLETESLDVKVLNRWHNFLGFNKDGTKRNYIKGRTYNIWSIT